ncbi:MAG: hypothetical protein ACOYOP_04775 [Microthrixaceae bacterium]
MVDDAAAPTAAPGEPSSEGAGDVDWAIDAVIGAAAVAARTATGVTGAVVTSGPARMAAGFARRLTRPLSDHGHEVRERVVVEAGPAASEAVRKVTPGVLDAIDLDSVVGAIDVNALVGQVDVNALVGEVDVDGIVSKVDVEAIIDRVDVEAIINRVDIGSILDRVDIEALLDRIDVNALVARIDLNELLEHVDLDQLLEKVDLNAIVQRLDVDALVGNTELGSIIAQSTSGIASEALDAVRSQGVGLDNFIARMANRVLRRNPAELPPGPTLLVDQQLALPAGDRPEPPGWAAGSDATEESAADGTAADDSVDDMTAGGSTAAGTASARDEVGP